MRGAILALAALLLQLTLAFGHLHLRGQGGAVLAQHHSAVAQSSSQTPTQNTNDDDYCAICVSIFLASSAFAPTPPQLLLPILSQPLERFFVASEIIGKPQLFAFRSRAPPAA
jgi:hypothetical protein